MIHASANFGFLGGIVTDVATEQKIKASKEPVKIQASTQDDAEVMRMAIEAYKTIPVVETKKEEVKAAYTPQDLQEWATKDQPTDQDKADELMLWADNDSDVYRQKEAYLKNVARKIKSKRYDAEKAVKLWEYFMETVAQSYAAQVFENKAMWSKAFTPVVRKLAAKEYSEQEFKNLNDGNYGEIIPGFLKAIGQGPAEEVKASGTKEEYTVAEYEDSEGNKEWAVLQSPSNVWIFPKGEETPATREEAEAKAKALRASVKASAVRKAEVGDHIMVRVVEGEKVKMVPILVEEVTEDGGRGYITPRAFGKQKSQGMIDFKDRQVFQNNGAIDILPDSMEASVKAEAPSVVVEDAMGADDEVAPPKRTKFRHKEVDDEKVDQEIARRQARNAKKDMTVELDAAKVKAEDDEMLTWYAGGNNAISLDIKREDMESVPKSGPADEYIADLLTLPYIKKQTDAWDKEALAEELEGYSDWDVTNHQDNVERMLWLAVGDLRQEDYEKEKEGRKEESKNMKARIAARRLEAIKFTTATITNLDEAHKAIEGGESPIAVIKELREQNLLPEALSLALEYLPDTIREQEKTPLKPFRPTEKK